MLEFLTYNVALSLVATPLIGIFLSRSRATDESPEDQMVALAVSKAPKPNKTVYAKAAIVEAELAANDDSYKHPARIA